METGIITLSSPPQESQASFFNCGVCRGAPFEPIATVCGHLFCWECLYSTAGLQDRQIFDCPSCNISMQIKQVTPIYVHTEIPQKRSEGIPHRPQIESQGSESKCQARDDERLLFNQVNQSLPHEAPQFDFDHQLTIAKEEVWKIVPILVVLLLPYIFELITGTNFFTYCRRSLISEVKYKDLRLLIRSLVALGYHSWLQAFTFGCILLSGLLFVNTLSAKAFKRQR